MQKMMTKELQQKMPALRETEGLPDTERKVVAHWFSVWTGWDWFGIEYDEEDQIVYGFVSGFANEFGEFSLTQFEEMNRSRGFAIVERDIAWKPITVAELKREYGITW